MANTTAPTENTKAKKPKAKGPIRFEAVIPFTIFVAIVWLYFALFFDSHLRKGLEFVGTYANGAEVNIDDVDTSFFNASLEIKNIQVTDIDQPQKNKVQVGTVRWRMLWDALLRGKIAVADASILEIGISTARKTPGRVLPPPPPGSKSSTEKIRDLALDQIQNQYSSNVLGDIAQILGGKDPKDQLKDVEASIKSVLRIKELQTDLKDKEKQWKERIANLPQSDDLKNLQARLKTVKLDGFKNAGEFQASLKELDTIYRDADSKIKNVEATGKALGGDVNTYQNTLKDLDAMIRKDIDDLEARLRIPKLDVKNLAMSMFGPLFLTKLKEAKFYMEKAREYMPPEKNPEEKAKYDPPKPRERIAGRTYKFGRPNTYPLFWLAKAEISSNPKGSAFSGDVKGTLKDLTNDPPVLGRPTVLTFEGDFPNQDMSGVFGEIVVDHTTTSPEERATIRVGNYRINGQTLVDSSDIQLAFDDARARSEIRVALKSENISFELENVFSQIKYNVGAKNQLVRDIVSNIINSVPQVTLNGAVRGTWSDLDLQLNSNLGAELQKGFEKELQARINEAKAKVKAMVDEKIGAEKEKLMAEYNKIQSQIKGEFAAREGEINKFKAQIDQEKKKLTDGQKKKLEGEAKKGLEKLLKGGKLKF